MVMFLQAPTVKLSPAESSHLLATAGYPRVKIDT